ncbi:MAG: hypothetical protein Q6L49_08380, partial [Thermostichales cyanobacterium HHBFW_bins_127]
MASHDSDLNEVKVYRSQDLQAKGINPETVSTLTFRGKVLSKGTTFSPDQRQRAYQLCQLYLDTNILSILTDNAGSLTLWFEHREQRSDTVLSPGLSPGSGSSPPSEDPAATVPIEDFAAPAPEPPRPVSSGSRKPVTFRGRPVGGSEVASERPVSQPPAPERRASQP